MAVGVTAYQLADIAKTTTIATLQGRKAVLNITRDLQKRLTRLFDTGVVTPTEHDTELARQSARGVVHAADETPATLEQLARPAVVGIVRALGKAHVSPYDAIRGAAYGLIEGAKETGASLARAAVEAVTSAKEAARALHLKEDEAVAHASRGVTEAAAMLGPQAAAEVADALSQLARETPGPTNAADRHE